VTSHQEVQVRAHLPKRQSVAVYRVLCRTEMVHGNKYKRAMDCRGGGLGNENLGGLAMYTSFGVARLAERCHCDAPPVGRKGWGVCANQPNVTRRLVQGVPFAW